MKIIIAFLLMCVGVLTLAAEPAVHHRPVELIYKQLSEAEVAAMLAEKPRHMGPRQPEAEVVQPSWGVNLFRPMSAETNIQEGVWQVLNVIDTLQTIEIAKNPSCYEEVGTARMFVGAHPSKKEAIGVGIGFGVLHYIVTRSLENLVDRNPDYRVLQRTWQYTGYVWKGYAVANNHRIGLRPGSSKLQLGRDGVCRR